MVYISNVDIFVDMLTVDRARASFRQGLRLGSGGIRGRGLRLAGYLTPPSDVTQAEEEADTLEQWYSITYSHDFTS